MRNISSVNTESTKGIYKANITINTCHIDDWYKLSDNDRKFVTDERSRLGLGRGGGHGGRNREQGGLGRHQASTSQLTKANATYKRRLQH